MRKREAKASALKLVTAKDLVDWVELVARSTDEPDKSVVGHAPEVKISAARDGVGASPDPSGDRIDHHANGLPHAMLESRLA